MMFYSVRLKCVRALNLWKDKKDTTACHAKFRGFLLRRSGLSKVDF